MLGAIVGDIIGSRFEPRNYHGNHFKSTEFELFTDNSRYTDDTICTCGIAYAILHGMKVPNKYALGLHKIGHEHPERGWGKMFGEWVMAPTAGPPFNSWGNGSAMRVSPIAWAFETADDVIEEARKSAEATHNHPEGVKGAEATALAIWLARQRMGKQLIREAIGEFYPLDRDLEQIRKENTFETSCKATIPVAATAFLESEDFEDCIRKAVSVGGDSDTIASIAGALAHAYYKEIPEMMLMEAFSRLEPDLIEIVQSFCRRFERGEGGSALWLPPTLPHQRPGFEARNEEISESLEILFAADIELDISIPGDDETLYIRQNALGGYTVGIRGDEPWDELVPDMQDAIALFIAKRVELGIGSDYNLAGIQKKYDLDPAQILKDLE
jgi:ADP-ribosylglycohydrolase